MNANKLLSLIAVALAGTLLGCRSEPPREAEAGGPAGTASSAAAASFAKAPALKRVDGKVVISFAAAAPVDATVEILDPEGAVVRHLASGLLGPKAPAPFRKGSLEQELTWDGKDDAGKDAPAECTVRVGLGLGGELSRIITWEPPSVLRRGIVGLSADRKGNVYFLQGACWMSRCGTPELTAFSRDGKYLRTLIPPPASRLQSAPDVTVRRSITGELMPRSPHPNLVPGLTGMRRQVMVSRGGRLFIIQFKAARRPGQEKSRRRILSIGHDGRLVPQSGGAKALPYTGPALPGFTTRSPAMYLTADAEGKTFYLAGLKHDKRGLHHAVYRAKWTDEEFQPFLGKAFEKGADPARFDDPRGLAVDAGGRLLVCDYRNDRVQVFSPAGRLLKSLAVTGPEQVEVHPRTGAVYVFSVRKKASSRYRKDVPTSEDYEDKAVIKFAGIDDWRPVASTDLPRRKRHMHDPGPIMTLDASRKLARLWVSCVGRAEPTDYLWLLEDQGKKLARLRCPIPRYRWPFGSSGGSMICDRKRDVLYLAGRAVNGVVLRVDGKTGFTSSVEPIARETVLDKKIPTDHLQISGLALDAEGRLYVRLMKPWSGRENYIRRYDYERDGKRVPFSAAGPEIKITQPSHGYHPGGFTVAPNGDMYVVDLAEGKKHRAKDEHNVLNVYGPDGKLKRTAVIPWLGSAVWGPKIDGAGNLYFTDAVCPAGKKPEGKTNVRKGRMMRGSLVKYGPTGIRQVFGEGKAGAADAPYVLREREGRYPRVRLEGLKWLYYGVSPVPFGHCICPAASFDLDGHARAVVPDTQNFCFKVVDSAGNFVTALGGYGNFDSAGPKSRYPQPAIPLRSIAGIAVSDKAAYIYDPANRRVLRVRWTYRAEKLLRIH